MVVVEVVTTGSGFQRAEDVEVWAASLNAVDKDDERKTRHETRIWWDTMRCSSSGGSPAI